MCVSVFARLSEQIIFIPHWLQPVGDFYFNAADNFTNMLLSY